MIILDDLALVLPDRAAVGTAATELIEAVQLHERAAAMAHDADLDPNEWARYQNNVGGAYWELHLRTAESTDLSAAVVGFERSVAATPSASPDLTMRLSKFAMALGRRHRLGHADIDLSRAVDLAEDAIRNGPVGGCVRCLSVQAEHLTSKVPLVTART